MMFSGASGALSPIFLDGNNLCLSAIEEKRMLSGSNNIRFLVPLAPLLLILPQDN